MKNLNSFFIQNRNVKIFCDITCKQTLTKILVPNAVTENQTQELSHTSESQLPHSSHGHGPLRMHGPCLRVRDAHPSCKLTSHREFSQLGETGETSSDQSQHSGEGQTGINAQLRPARGTWGCWHACVLWDVGGPAQGTGWQMRLVGWEWPRDRQTPGSFRFQVSLPTWLRPWMDS